MAAYPVKDFLKTNPTYFAWKKYTHTISCMSGTCVGDSDTRCILMRFPEVLLMYAEALNETGRLSDALTALNAVRTRFLPASTAQSKSAISAAIQYERDGVCRRRCYTLLRLAKVECDEGYFANSTCFRFAEIYHVHIYVQTTLLAHS